MPIYVTKYFQAGRGIIEAREISRTSDGTNLVTVEWKGAHNNQLTLGKPNWHDSLADAVADCENRRQKALKRIDRDRMQVECLHTNVIRNKPL